MDDSLSESESRRSQRRVVADDPAEQPRWLVRYVVLAIIGLTLVLVGTGLLYVFRDPKFGHGLMLESFDPDRERRGARLGALLIVAGSALQVIAVVMAEA